MLIPAPVIRSFTALARRDWLKDPLSKQVLSSGHLKGIIARVRPPLWASLEDASSQDAYLGCRKNGFA